MESAEKIIVGVDGSDGAYDAVAWAAEEAVRRGRGLRIIFAIAPWIFEEHDDPKVSETRRRLREGGRGCAGPGGRAGGRVAPEDLETEVVPGGAADALLREAPGMALVVVGGRGSGELTGLLLGSVGLQVVSHAPCPVVVVAHLEPGVAGEVAVGIDSAETAQDALGFAFEEAWRRGARLRAVHAWTDTHGHAAGDGAERGARVLAGALAGWRAKYPDVLVEDVVHRRTVRALTAASAHADVLVVGTRGGGEGSPGCCSGRSAMRCCTTRTARSSWCPHVPDASL